jgi:hypothetical protein
MKAETKKEWQQLFNKYREKGNAKLKYSSGNKKIGSDTIIINMGSATKCPSLNLGLCQLKNPLKECYAMKAERQYPSVLPYREAQADIWLNSSAEDMARSIFSIVAKRKKPIKYIRLNESGDFYSQDCIDKASKVAELIEPLGIKVYTYTARKDLNFNRIHKNITINGSGFMASNSFNSVESYTSRIRCGGDCRTCHICKVSRGVLIEVLKH